MEWSKFYNKFKDENINDVKNIAFVYVISQFNKPPYKIGLTKSDLYRRFGNYQTSFIDFHIHYLIMTEYGDVSKVESLLHKDVELEKYRVKFPDKTPGQQKRFSEWFDINKVSGKTLDLKTIEYSIRRVMYENKDIQTIFGYDLTKPPKIIDMAELENSKGDPNFGWYISKSGTIHRMSNKKKTAYNQIFFDNNRLFSSIDYSMYDEPKVKREPKEYIGMKVTADEDEDNDEGIVVKIKNYKQDAVIRWKIPVDYNKKNKPNYETTTTIKELEKYVKKHGFHKIKKDEK